MKPGAYGHAEMKIDKWTVIIVLISVSLQELRLVPVPRYMLTKLRLLANGQKMPHYAEPL